MMVVPVEYMVNKPAADLPRWFFNARKDVLITWICVVSGKSEDDEAE